MHHRNGGFGCSLFTIRSLWLSRSRPSSLNKPTRLRHRKSDPAFCARQGHSRRSTPAFDRLRPAGPGRYPPVHGGRFCTGAAAGRPGAGVGPRDAQSRAAGRDRGLSLILSLPRARAHALSPLALALSPRSLAPSLQSNTVAYKD
jgi:hypothetical protein